MSSIILNLHKVEDDLQEPGQTNYATERGSTWLTLDNADLERRFRTIPYRLQVMISYHPSIEGGKRA